jgi:hypothetical protein
MTTASRGSCMLMSMKRKLLWVIALTASLRLFAESPALAPDSALKWDADLKEYALKTGETSAAFTFNATNTSNAEISIDALRTSCGCTVAQLPTTPYKLAPGSSVAINVAMDLRGKAGLITKSVNVETSAGGKTLLVRANVPTETKIESK